MNFTDKIARHINTYIDNEETSRDIAEDIRKNVRRELYRLIKDSEGDMDYLAWKMERLFSLGVKDE